MRCLACCVALLVLSAQPRADLQEATNSASPDIATAARAPEVVVRGRSPALPGCGSCHLTTGLGRPGSARLAGLPAGYIALQVDNYRKGLRGTGDTATPSGGMAAVARTLDNQDIRAAAEYFASLGVLPRIRVVETEPVSGQLERLGPQIVEAEDAVRDSGRAASPGVVAYVPFGAIKRGERLVTTGGSGRTVRCALCHGENLRGSGTTPRLAGQLPSYVTRQLLDMQAGARHGAGPDLMMATVARLSSDDVVAIAAYTASLAP